MTILALDTSGPVCSVAVMREGVLLYEARVINKLTHSINLMPMVEDALQKSGCERKDLTHIAAVIGPGSFTGVRIGVAVAQGLARGLGISCMPVNALEAMAKAIFIKDTLVCPIRDARAGQVYGATFLNGKRVMDDCALKLDAYLQQLAKYNETPMFLGDGVPILKEKIIAALGEKAVFAGPSLLQPGAAFALELAMDKADDAVQPEQLMPLYLRAPQAERQRMEQSDAR